MAGIFICYRREDSAGYAGRLYDRLAAHFGKNNVFMDVDNIEPGVDFTNRIQQVIARSSAMVVVIGKQWLTGGDPFGRRRLGDLDDPVRLEIRSALQRQGVTVVPVLVHGAVMPAQGELPVELRDLTRFNAGQLRHTTWGSDVRRLIRALEPVVGRPKRPTAPKQQTRNGKNETPATGGRKKRAGRPPEKQSAKRVPSPDGEATPPKQKLPRAPAPRAGAEAGERKSRDGAVPTKKPAAKKKPDPKEAAPAGTARKKTAKPGGTATKKAPVKSAGTAKRRRRKPSG